MGDIHIFHKSVAQECGIVAAVILENFALWIEHNMENEINCFEGRYWTYNSMKAFEQQFPYLTVKQIRTGIDKLMERGFIVKGNYNKSAYDRTSWYSITEEGYSVLNREVSFQKGQMHLPKKANGVAQKGKPIPDIIPGKKEDAIASTKETGQKRFRPPSVEEVEAYCQEQGFTETDADDFTNFYAKKGWVVGKTQMKDWKAAVRNWENTERKRKRLPSIGEMRKARKQKEKKGDELVEYPTGSGRKIPVNQARREANLEGAYREYPPGSGNFLPPWEIAALEAANGGGSV